MRSISSLINWVLQRAWRRGVRGGSRAWLGAGALALAARVLIKAAAREQVVVYREPLFPGERLMIEHREP